MARISVPREVLKPQESLSDGTDAVGFIQFWGNSPALDLLGDPQAASFGPLAIGTSPSGVYKDDTGNEVEKQATEAEKESQSEAEERCDDAAETLPELIVINEADPVPAPLPEGDDPVNILVTGGYDVRHVLKTVAKRQLSGTPRRRLRFFLHETRYEVLARHLLFLQIMNNTTIPVRERMELFLSLYGNTLVREKDCAYVEEIAPEFIEIVTDNSTHPLTEVVDLNHLKYKDRDMLQDVYKGWLKDVPFDVEALREQRCRGYYRERYDFRKNAMDWDYQTHIKDRAGIINWFHYKEFCFTGVALETRLASYSTPNRTVASYTEGMDRTKGTTVQVRGFWGDIINSPYHAFSTTAHPDDRPRLFKISGSQYRHTETDIAEFNVTAFLSEMETGRPYRLPPETPEEHRFPYASPVERLLGVEANGIEEVAETPPPAPGGDGQHAGGRASRRRGAQRKKREDWPSLSPGFEGIEVVLLAGPLLDLLKKPKYTGFFHRAFVGAMATGPVFEDFGVQAGGIGTAEFQAVTKGKIRAAPRLQAPGLFGKMQDKSVIAGAMASGACMVFETLKYQAHFEGLARLGFRHKIAQAGHLAGWRLLDERHAVPRLENDMKEKRANELEKDATDFLRFVTPAAISAT
eukprot:TRINITY_DN30574_c0_g1_i1.p1 TRINITY_DN30574_c0_g1~~TRINITY_DN30574_c0_g1_i1.p1  ORF type:complete len:636 (-),score=121.13 TRINITY_DN30574_c0_g1_i1:64-1971(-)